MLIADDEPEVLEGLKILIDWNQLGFEVTDTSINGRDALNKLKNGNFRLVITDMRMPGMNGLELISTIRLEYPFIKVIILSGYGEFSYAQQAIKLGVSDYLLKPVDVQELKTALSAIKEEFAQSESNLRSVMHYNDIARDRFLYDFSEGNIVESKAFKKSAQFGIGLEYAEFCVALLKIDNLIGISNGNIEDANLYKFAVRNMAEDLIQASSAGYVFEDIDGMIGVLFYGTATHQKSVENSLNRVICNSFKHLNLKVAAAVGAIVAKIEDIRLSKQQAKQTLDSMYLAKNRGLLFYSDLNVNEVQVSQLNWDYSTLLTALRDMNVEKIDEEIDATIKSLQNKQLTKEIIQALSYNFFFAICSFIRENNGDSAAVFGRADTDILTEGISNLDNLKGWMRAICKRALSYISELNGVRTEKTIDILKKYIEENYQKDLNLKSLSSTLYMNPAYLGRLIKNTYGESFTDYLNKKRISEIKRLIFFEGYKAYDAIAKAGYKNTEYFYRQFKKFENVSFADYRKKLLSATGQADEEP